MQRQRVLFVCTYNSARSQMAEGMLHAWGGEGFAVASAGMEATRVRPEAVAVMAEIGIDISRQQSKTVNAVHGQRFDRLITVCDTARQNCPHIPGIGLRDHWSVDDPASLDGPDEERLAAFRRARDELADRVHELIVAAERDPASAASSRATED